MPPSRKQSLSIAACLALVLLLASLGAVGLPTSAQTGTDAAQPQAAGDLALPERVVLPDADASGSAVVGMDAGAAVDRSGSQLDGAYNRYLFEARLEEAEDDEERRAIIRETVSEINESTDRLSERERQARSDYRNGAIDERAYLTVLSSVNDEAEQLEALAEVIDPVDPRSSGIADEYSASSASSELGTIRGNITAHQGPVRSQIGEMMAGERSPSRVHVVAAESGTVISTIHGGEYHREAIRTDLLVSGSQRGISLSEAYDLAADELYPQYQSQFSSVGLGVNRQFYRVLGEGGANYHDSNLLSYIDANSENVFWEYQRLGLTQELPRASSVTNTSGTLTVSVRPTYGTGPASVHVTESGTVAANVSVSVDGEVVAETDDQGVAWIVVPNEGATVSVTTGGETTRVVLD